MTARKPERKRFPGLLHAALTAVVLTAALTGAAIAQPDIQEDLRYARSLSRAFQYAAERIEPSVVHVQTFKQVPDRRDYFGRIHRGGMRSTGVGSGVIMTSDGYVLTNNHVIEGSDQVILTLANGEQFEATIVGADPDTDMAVLKLPPNGYTPATFGNSDNLNVGEWVIAVGSPFGFEQSVTAGIVSAKGRRGIGLANYKYEEFIQTDAAINPGNSGGPLINLEGQIIGINSAIASRSGGSVGIGFAIPSQMAKAVMDAIIEHGRVLRGWIGVDTEDLTPDLVKKLNLGESGGVLIRAIIENSPAQRAGLHQGDVILSFNNSPTSDSRKLLNRVALTSPGTQARLQLLRQDGTRESKHVLIGDRAAYLAQAVGGIRLADLGLTVRTLTPQLIRELGYRDPFDGVVVYNVEYGSPSHEAGFEANDILLAVDDTPLAKAEEFRREIYASDLTRGVRIKVIRRNQRGYLDLRTDR